jgi:hypothetical protein
MEAASAHSIARSTHAGRATRDGRPLIDHVECVAGAPAALPAEVPRRQPNQR